MAITFETSLLQSARELRKRQTIAESEMWNIIRGRQMLGLRFLRQKPILSYIVDFYCSDLKLAIEIDGPVHDDQKEADRIRTKNLETKGVTVIRYTNDQIIDNLSSVIKDLRLKITALESSLP